MLKCLERLQEVMMNGGGRGQIAKGCRTDYLYKSGGTFCINTYLNILPLDYIGVICSILDMSVVELLLHKPQQMIWEKMYSIRAPTELGG